MEYYYGVLIEKRMGEIIKEHLWNPLGGSENINILFSLMTCKLWVTIDYMTLLP